MFVELKLNAHSTSGSTFTPIGICPGLLWFLVPFLSEFFSNNTKSERYLYIAALFITAWVASELTQLDPWTSTVLVTPTLIVLIAIGVDKLIPTIAGENPRPILRYGLPAAAIGILCAYQLTLMQYAKCTVSTNTTTPEITPGRRLPNPPLQRAAVIVAKPPAAITIKPAAAPVRVTKHTVPTARTNQRAPKATHLIKTTGKKSVSSPRVKVRPVPRVQIPRYVRKNGRIVRRSKWAIQWQLHHPYRY